MSNESYASIANNPDAPADERAEASAALHKAYAPSTESGLVMPVNDLMSMAADVRADMEEIAMQKANVVPFPSPNSGSRGKQSVNWDPYQATRSGEYWERPSNVSFDQMRIMVERTPVLNAVVMTRVRQAMRYCRPQEGTHGPGFAIRHVDTSHELTDSESESIDLLQRFIANCGWEFNPRKRRRLGRDSFATMMGKSVRDSLILDSAPIETEMKRDPKLGMDGFYAVDGATIRLTPDEGYKGDPDTFALQVIQGRVCTPYTRDDLIYEPRNPRSDVILAGYGLSEVELLVKIVTGFLNALSLNIRGFSDNAVPRGVMHLTGNYSQDDLVAFRRYWNSMVKGVNSTWSVPVLVSRDQESKAEFQKLDGQFDEMYFSKWMTFLTSIVCAVYGMSPDEINFESFAVSQSSLSGSDTSEKLASSKDKGLRPLLSYYESLISDYVICEFGDKYAFRWAGLDVDDEDKRFEMRKMVLTLNEARSLEGYEPIEGPLGDAPINASMAGLWSQMQQDGDDDEQDFGSRGDPGEQKDSPQPDFGKENGQPEDKGPDFGQEQDGQSMTKAMTASSHIYRIGDGYDR